MIKVEDVSFSYLSGDDEEEKIFENLSLEIDENIHTCILGHNGSGKSTLAKMFIGLISPNTGKIIVDGLEQSPENVYKIRRKIGTVFQNPDNQFIGSTVKDDIAFGLENYQIDPRKMPEIIEKFSKMVGMESYLEHEPTRLSGGQKQRVAIAGVLAMNPQILIFDEATSMLDPVGVNEVNNSIAALQKSGEKTIISITHDIDYAMNTDYVIVLDKGKVILQGNPETVFKNNYELLVEIGLDIPFALKISNRLQKDGYNIHSSMTLKELDEQLCQSR
ncbi:energy-coupling factor transporter ATPase [Mycoplasma sp. P36-A1]|uniref:energy-coupling factor transporter ATPase n=1 Tax=Mycoplasma sp. P36-A1 TaxID=3252900 RepID=UPI003C2DB3D1